MIERIPMVLRQSLIAATILMPMAASAGSLVQPVGEPVIVGNAPVAQARVGNTFGFTLRGGVATRPGYFGSDEYEVGPDLGFALERLRFGFFDIGNDDPGYIATGFGLRGSFRYVPERSADDYEELAGLEDIDATYELGLGVTYSQPLFEVFADLRYGIGGHESLVAELGADAILRVSDRLTLRAGPRVLLGSDDYASTYFGVTEAEAAASDYAAYDAEGGLLSAGVELQAAYMLTERWGIEGAVGYDRFLNDAEDSPITVEDEQFTARLGVTRRFDFRF
ncbi:MipA/OmpV family protein [Pseudoroseicyclus aestuarii]|uniref:Outer membrane scaffolding protein for murein synthesis (MipA/OmpV family) n=1 Tax=Pseudoroseicyclus aestuarii TaxID=1795041 RepID=A0A318SUW5_9RHOB|nr:MipA/OmpV family protein [Pseudoroseicyclus aestuarii]PYE85701.1 outer membrane scaffolding protein for murein synthesis (MipA/OmpV family) [Pseudoroseicyclus aestuarii]